MGYVWHITHTPKRRGYGNKEGELTVPNFGQAVHYTENLVHHYKEAHLELIGDRSAIADDGGQVLVGFLCAVAYTLRCTL